MMDLTLTQQLTLNDIKLAPKFDDTCDYFKYDGLVFGDWNTHTLNALDNKGLVDFCGVCRDGKTKYVALTERV